MSTSTLVGHVDTIGALPLAGRRRQRLHSNGFKTDCAVAASQSGMSVASGALAHVINANLLRRWVREVEMPPTKKLAKAVPAASTLVVVQLPEPVAPAGEIRIDVRGGAAAITVAWPMAAAAKCAGWMRELLR